MMTQRMTPWGLKVLVGNTDGIELWETMPKFNHYGGVRREVGETFQLDGATYTVLEVTPSAALCKQTAAKIVQYTTDDGEKKEIKIRSSSTIRVASYRERNKKVDRGGGKRKRLLRGTTLAG